MANASLEKYVMKLSAGFMAVCSIVVLCAVPERGWGIAGYLTGSLLSISNFLATAFLFSGIGGKRSGRGRGLSSMGLIASFSLMLAVFFLTSRVNLTLFWSAVAGVLTVPFSVMVYTVMEAAGITHTGYFV